MGQPHTSAAPIAHPGMIELAFGYIQSELLSSGGRFSLIVAIFQICLCCLVHAGVFNVSSALHPRFVDRELDSQFGNLFAHALLGLGVSGLR